MIAFKGAGAMNNESRSGRRPLKVGLTYNLKRQDHDDAEAEFDDIGTIEAIQKALTNDGTEVELFEAREDLPERIRVSRPDIVFNIAEGVRGRSREGQIPAILEYLDIPYTGSDATALGVSLDKAAAKELLSFFQVRTPRFALIKAGSIRETDESGDRRVPDLKIFGPSGGFTYPVLVKPNTEGSGKGIDASSLAYDDASMRRTVIEEIARYGEDILVEEFVAGREFTVGILGNGSGRRVFPPMEILFLKKTDANIYTYDVKKNYRKYVRYECPAALTDGQRTEMEEMAERVFDGLGCRDFARIDFRMNASGEIFFIEANPIPGLAPNYSDYPMTAEAAGIDYETLIRSVLNCALERYGIDRD